MVIVFAYIIYNICIMFLLIASILYIHHIYVQSFIVYVFMAILMYIHEYYLNMSKKVEECSKLVNSRVTNVTNFRSRG